MRGAQRAAALFAELLEMVPDDLAGECDADSPGFHPVELDLETFLEGPGGNTRRIKALDHFQDCRDFLHAGLDILVECQIVDQGVQIASQITGVIQVPDDIRCDDDFVIADLIHTQLGEQVILEADGGDHRDLTAVVLGAILASSPDIRGEDPAAFVVVSDTTEVMGHRIGNQPHW